LSKVGNSERSKAIRLLAAGLTQSEASRKLGISRQKLSLWCKKEAFQQELLDAKKKLLQTPIDTKLDEPVINQPQTKPLVQKVDSKQQLREKELSLLENIESAMLLQLREGSSIRAAMVLLKLIETRSKLLGLNQKNYLVLEAAEFLFTENVIPPQRIEKLRLGLQNLESDLKATP
jgi:transcriptional regulator with XRE-family HTH domain